MRPLALVTDLIQRHARGPRPMPPHAYQIQLRVALAKRLLLSGAPVGAVAYQAGFFDPSHFTRPFKRHVGVPPGAYATP